MVPVNLVEDIDQAIDLVDSGVGDASIMLLDEDGDFETKKFVRDYIKQNFLNKEKIKNVVQYIY